MKEFKIILPLPADHHSHTTRDKLKAAHAHLAIYLPYHFGGYTAHDASGAWRTPEDGNLYEEVRIYVFAIKRAALFECDAKARDIVRYLLGETGEDCVYFRGASGEVELLSLDSDSLSQPTDKVFPRKGGGTYRAIDPALHTREALARNRIK